MTTHFRTIGIMGKHRSDNVKATVTVVVDYLQQRQINVIVDEEAARVLSKEQPIKTIARPQLGANCDLIIVVGGDGSFLSAARAVISHQIPIIGINRGNLGFLTDITPKKITAQLDQVLAGEFTEEKRFLLHCDVVDKDNMLADSDALNDVVLMPGDVAHMIEFEIYIDKQFVCFHRADGMIVATPTGSTAYALSGGGPILHPQLNAVVLVPMFPHTLSSRPLVIHGDSVIEFIIAKNNITSPRVSCDGQARVPVPPNSKICIKKLATPLRLIHPKTYDFYETLRSKLGWLSKNHTKHVV